MATCIEAVATATHRGRVFGRGALHLSDAAAKACLRRAHRSAGELDLLVNVGIYKDWNAAEPALASIIQEDVGANPGHPPRPGHHGTFSFDLENGGCGVLTAIQVIDGFIEDGALGLVVAADADPSPRTSLGFPFAAAGGAVLLRRDTHGFERFASRTFPQHAALFESVLRWEPGAGLLKRGRNIVEVREAPGFASACVEDAALVARQVLDATDIAEIDLLVTSQYPARFGLQLARALGISTEHVPVVATELATAHTAGPLAALEEAVRTGGFERARQVLFVTVGAGITVVAALYRNA